MFSLATDACADVQAWQLTECGHVQGLKGASPGSASAHKAIMESQKATLANLSTAASCGRAATQSRQTMCHLKHHTCSVLMLHTHTLSPTSFTPLPHLAGWPGYEPSDELACTSHCCVGHCPHHPAGTRHCRTNSSIQVWTTTRPHSASTTSGCRGGPAQQTQQ